MSEPQGVSPLEESIPEFTAKAVVAGVLLGLVFGAANAYLGLRVGLTVSASIPAAVMTVALFRLFGTKGTILEANLSQTIGSASTVARDGHDLHDPGALPLGHGAAVPAGRRALLPRRAPRPLGDDPAAAAPDRRRPRRAAVPEGTACAEVLRATAADSSGQRVDLPRHGGRRGGEARGRPLLPRAASRSGRRCRSSRRPRSPSSSAPRSSRWASSSGTARPASSSRARSSRRSSSSRSSRGSARA